MKEKPKNPLNQLIKNRIKITEQHLKDWRELESYIKPFVSQNEQMLKVLQKINTNFITYPVDDLVLITALQAERMAHSMFMPKLFCLKCEKELKKEKENK